MKVDDKLLKRSLNAAITYSEIKKEGFKDKVRKFDESIDLIINLKEINLNDPKARLDKEIILPNDVITNKIPNICVIASDEILMEAKKLGIETLNKDELEALDRGEKKYKKKFVKKFDYFVVEDKLMRDVAKYLARFLGPTGKMPKPFPTGYGIINTTDDLKNALERYKKIVRIQIKKQPVIMTKLGKKSMNIDKVFENTKVVVEFIAEQLPRKYNNIKSIYIKTTMGRPIKTDPDYLKNLGV